MKLSEIIAQNAVERRKLAGLPVIPCPNCGRVEAHWVADRLGDDGLVVHGYFTCEVRK